MGTVTHTCSPFPCPFTEKATEKKIGYRLPVLDRQDGDRARVGETLPGNRIRCCNSCSNDTDRCYVAALTKTRCTGWADV